MVRLLYVGGHPTQNDDLLRAGCLFSSTLCPYIVEKEAVARNRAMTDLERHP